MARLQDLTEVMVASWILAGNGNSIPTSHGLLDRALQAAQEKGAFGAWGKDLHFVDSRVGLQCVELPRLLDWAQRAQLTTSPNPSYSYTQIQVGERAARSMLNDLGVTLSDAAEWGELLQTAVIEARKSLAEFGSASIEEY